MAGSRPSGCRLPTVSALDSSLDKSGRSIRDMFAGVAPRYDLLNRLLSARLDVLWRRRSARQLAARTGETVLDLCCGTGDQALAIAQSGARVVAADFCLPMLALAQRKPAPGKRRRLELATADALVLPFADDTFDAASVSFGLRNVADLDRALAELARVLKPGGRLAVLEFALPERTPVRQLYLFYFLHILPRVGRLLSPRGSAYSYLPASVVEFPQRQGFTARMLRAGFGQAAHEDLTLGTVCLYTGRK
jgi:demethylmenaquinone methyltransferase / 2-methoxy-6-polyprenyl-1,4-benzoquinol methylase